jgi:isopentenyl diphosphate isomerase/L-lactate dehydrogenase-like FMN-dependent dehydrogenase
MDSEHSTPSATNDDMGESRFETLYELYDAARANLDDATWAYLEGGAGLERSVVANRHDFERWNLLPSPLSGCGSPNTQTSFLGIELAAPILTGPVGTSAAFHPDGDAAVARAAERCAIASIVPVLSSLPLEQTKAAAPTAARIFQVLASGSEDHFLKLVDRAGSAGYDAICITIDAYPRGFRDRVLSARFQLADDAAYANYDIDDAAELAAHSELGLSAWTWSTVADLIAEVPLPVMLKGVLTVRDAKEAVAAGAAAIMVSNVGGRQLDCVPSAISQLPEIIDAVGDQTEVAFDSGVRRGTDVLKALALGARVISLGRTVAYGLAADGEAGVVRTLELVESELTVSMALCGTPSIDSIDRSILKSSG